MLGEAALYMILYDIFEIVVVVADALLESGMKPSLFLSAFQHELFPAFFAVDHHFDALYRTMVLHVSSPFGSKMRSMFKTGRMPDCSHSWTHKELRDPVCPKDGRNIQNAASAGAGKNRVHDFKTRCFQSSCAWTGRYGERSLASCIFQMARIHKIAISGSTNHIHRCAANCSK